MRRITRPLVLFLGSIMSVATAGTAQAALIDLGPGSFTPAAATVTFDEFALGTVNPSIALAAGTLGIVTVTTGGHFLGQTTTGGNPDTLLDTTPLLGPALALDPAAPQTRTVTDAAPGATCPCLSGTPTFNGVISVLFSTPVAAVGLKGGFFNAVGGTSIFAYGADGTVLGGIVNTVGDGFEFYGLADSTGANVISGLSFFITGAEPAGFEIDNLTFGAAEVLTPEVPEPASLLLLGTGLLGIVWRTRQAR